MQTIEALEAGPASRLYGVYPALVTDIKDPESLGRVKVALPGVPGSGKSSDTNWARLATLMGGNRRGSWFLPEVNDEVLVAFEGGDPRKPYVIGALWNGVDAPPEVMDAEGKNNRKVLRSRNGVTLTLDDQDGAEQMILETPGGQRVTLKDGPGAIVIEDSNGNSVQLSPDGVKISAADKIAITASAVDVSAGSVTVNAALAKFSGVIQAETVISNQVISASYSPGAGNIW